MAFPHPWRGLAALLLVTAAGGAGAQAPAAPAAGKTLSLGGGTAAANSKVLTRDELRACMTQRDTLASRTAELERQRAALDAERDSLQRERDGLTATRAKVEQSKTAIGDFEAKLTAYKTKVDDWQARATAFSANPGTGMMADRRRATLEREQAALNDEQKALEAERGALTTAANQAVSDFNANAAAVDGKLTQWNERNGQLNAQSQTVSEERQIWVTDCGNRRYREDDEIAIRNGK